MVKNLGETERIADNPITGHWFKLSRYAGQDLEAFGVFCNLRLINPWNLFLFSRPYCLWVVLNIWCFPKGGALLPAHLRKTLNFLPRGKTDTLKIILVMKHCSFPFQLRCGSTTDTHKNSGIFHPEHKGRHSAKSCKRKTSAVSVFRLCSGQITQMKVRLVCGETWMAAQQLWHSAPGQSRPL